MAVLGVDACRGGWVAVGLEGSGVSAHTAASIGELMEVAGPAEVVGIDIPIGLPATGRRRADCIARSLLGPRRSSVFFAPPRDVLVAPGHREAADRCERLCGYRVSQQAYRLGPKILEVESWLADYPGPVIEVHPEVSFTAMVGAPLGDPKTTWAGLEQRRQILAEHGIHLDGDLGLAGRKVAPDDVVDAAAAAWSANRHRSGIAEPHPDPPEPLADGVAAAIWT